MVDPRSGRLAHALLGESWAKLGRREPVNRDKNFRDREVIEGTRLIRTASQLLSLYANIQAFISLVASVAVVRVGTRKSVLYASKYY